MVDDNLRGDIFSYYKDAHKYLMDNGYQHEIDWCKNLTTFQNCDPDLFLQEYIWCVVNAGMKEQVARKIYCRFMKTFDLETIGHKGKRAAIETSLGTYTSWFSTSKQLKTDWDRIQYFQTFPWIGKITKYHLARNVGIDCVKPDRHLVRLAERFGYTTPLEMCEDIQKQNPMERLGTIDVVLWRYCNLIGG